MIALKKIGSMKKIKSLDAISMNFIFSTSKNFLKLDTGFILVEALNFSISPN